MALELVELALTWPELDYSEAAVVPPSDWLEFADRHRWPEPDMAHRLFRAARDVALRGVPTEPPNGARPLLDDPDVLERYGTTAWRQPVLSTPSQLGAIGETAEAALDEPSQSEAFQGFAPR